MSPASGLPVGTRKHLARYYLTHSAMTTGKIAYLLTYDDTKST
jgi:hypothetical protein